MNKSDRIYLTKGKSNAPALYQTKDVNRRESNENWSKGNVQQGQHPSKNDEYAPQVRKSACGEDLTSSVGFDVTYWVGVVEEVVWLCGVDIDERAPHLW